MKKNYRLIIGLFVMFLVTSVAQATVYIDDDLESGLNTTNSGAANYWYNRYGGALGGTLTTAQSNSPTTSLLHDGGGKEFFSGYPTTLWNGDRTSYETWLRLDGTGTAGWEDVAIWQNPNPLAYAPIVHVSRSASGNFRYQAGYEAGYDAWIDTGIAYNSGEWYHIGWDLNPADSTFDLYISTGAFTTPVASGSYASVPSWVGSMYFSSWSGGVQYYIDDVKIYSGAIPEPATLSLLAISAGCLWIKRKRS